LSIRGEGVSEDLLAFEDVGGTTKWHINQKPDGTKPGLNFAEPGVSKGVYESRLFIKAGGEIGIGTSTPTEGTKLTVSALANHLQLRRGMPLRDIGGNVLFLELFQDGPDDGKSSKKGVVYPSIRFNNNHRFSNRIEGRDDGIHFKEGGLDSNQHIGVFAKDITLSTDGALFFQGPPPTLHYIKPGIDFSTSFPISPISVPNVSNLSTNYAREAPNALKILGADGGVLATSNQEVLEWHDGGVVINGNLYAKEKRFLIDHPAKPGHKLAHSCLEGPEIGVYYRGAAQLRNGEATIKLPDYFEALTRKEGRTVQLTAKGSEPFRLSYEEVKDGQFKVYGTKNNGEFSWEVKAVREDVAELEVEVKK
jgi:hypothetical protein